MVVSALIVALTLGGCAQSGEAGPSEPTGSVTFDPCAGIKQTALDYDAQAKKLDGNYAALLPVALSYSHLIVDNRACFTPKEVADSEAFIDQHRGA